MPESKRFLELIEQMRDIHKRKNAGYAGKDTDDPWANFRMSNMLGVSPFKGCLVRMSDKFIRVANLSKDEENDQVGEPITDTLLDLACYSLIAICLYEDDRDTYETILENEIRTEHGGRLSKAMDQYEEEEAVEAIRQRANRKKSQSEDTELRTLKDLEIKHGFPPLDLGRPISPEFLERLSKAMDQYDKKENTLSNQEKRTTQALESLRAIKAHLKKEKNSRKDTVLWSALDNSVMLSIRTRNYNDEEGYWLGAAQKEKFITKASMYSLLVALADDLECRVVQKEAMQDEKYVDELSSGVAELKKRVEEEKDRGGFL